jgi:hypothetical protein
MTLSKFIADPSLYIFVAAIIGVQIPLPDFAQQRVTRVCARALVVKGLLCPIVQTVQEVLRANAVIPDFILLTKSSNFDSGKMGNLCRTCFFVPSTWLFLACDYFNTLSRGREA